MSQRLTCCGDSRKDPALSIFHRFPTGGVVFPQDLYTAAPRRRRDAVRVIPWPIPHQNAKVVLDVYLKRSTVRPSRFNILTCSVFLYSVVSVCLPWPIWLGPRWWDLRDQTGACHSFPGWRGTLSECLHETTTITKTELLQKNSFQKMPCAIQVT